MTQYNYICLNSKCSSKEVKYREFVSRYRKISRIGKIDNFVIEKEDKDKNKPEHCPECKKKLKLIGTLGTFNFSKMSFMNREQKQAMFKKRSHNHFKKKIQENQREIIKKTIPQD